MTAASKASGPVVAAAGLVRSFGVDRAVDTVDLTVAAGETHALVGLNGAGKTTVMKLLLVSSHHLDEVARIADRITVMHRGQVIGNLDPGGVDLEHRFFDMVYTAERQGPWTQQSPPRP